MRPAAGFPTGAELGTPPDRIVEERPARARGDAMRLRFALPFAVTVSCLPSNLIHYALQPQEFKQDFGSATGTLPMVPCTMDSQCNAVPVPAGVMPSPTMSCDPAAHACMATFDVRVYQQVDLSTEPNFPSSVLNAVVQTVSIDAVHYWTPTNTLTFTTPTIELWVGPQSATSETSAGDAARDD